MVVAAEGEAARAGEGPLEQRLAEGEAGGVGPEGPLHRRPDRRRRPVAGQPQRGGVGGAVGQDPPERAVEEDGHDVGEAGMVGHRRLGPVEETGAVVAGDLGQPVEHCLLREDPEALEEPGVDLGFGQRPVEGLEERWAQVEVVRRPLEGEERVLPLLVLGGGRQHVVGQGRRLGVGDVDDDGQLAGPDGRLEGGGVGHGVGRVPRLHEQGPDPVGVVGQDLLGQRVGRQQGGDVLEAGDLGAFPVGPAPQGLQPAVHAVGPRAAEVSGDQVEELLQVTVERRMAALLDPELDPDGHGPGGQDQLDGPFDVGHLDLGVGHPLGHRNAGEGGDDAAEALRVRFEPGGVVALALDDQGDDRRQQEGVGAGPQGQVQIGDVGGLGAAGIDDDHLALGAVLDLVHDPAGVAEAVGQPGVGADDHQEVAVVDALGGVDRLRAEHLPVHPEVARLLLGQGVEVSGRAHPGQQRPDVGPAGVVALPAAAVDGEGTGPARRPVGLPDRPEAGGDLADGGVPVDRLVGAVGPAPQRRREAVGAGAVEREALRFLADVAGGLGVGLVAPDPGDGPPLGLHLDAAVDVAEAAGVLLPVHRPSGKDSALLSKFFD